MRLENESEKLVKEKILAVIGKYLNLSEHRIFFFGSRVSGKGSKFSDIDIGIEGSKPLPTGVLSRIIDEVEELPILYKIDVVDFNQVNEGFKAVAKQHVEFVN